MEIVQNIHTQLVAVMDSLKGSGQPFAEVYPYPIASPELFPIAVIDIDSGGTQTDQSSNVKVLTVKFIVRCLFRQKNAQSATEQRLEVLDEVLSKFTEEGIADYLNDTVLGMDIESIEPFATGDINQPVFGFDLIIACRAIMEVA